MMSLFFVCQALAADIPGPSRAFYVNDYASVIPDYIFWQYANTLKKLDEEEKGQIVVSTISSLEGEQIEVYAQQMFDVYRIGGEWQKGALVLLVEDEKRAYIKAGAGLADVLTPEFCFSVAEEHAVKNIKKNRYKAALFEVIHALRKAIDPERHVAPPEKEFLETASLEGLFILPFLAAVFLFSTITFLRRKDKKEEGISAPLSGMYYGNWSFCGVRRHREEKHKDSENGR